MNPPRVVACHSELWSATFPVRLLDGSAESASVRPTDARKLVRRKHRPAAFLSKTNSAKDRPVRLGTSVNNAIPHNVSVTPATKANQP
jgi:hypothetical protein